jgi:hypothetical protein
MQSRKLWRYMLIKQLILYLFRLAFRLVIHAPLGVKTMKQTIVLNECVHTRNRHWLAAQLYLLSVWSCHTTMTQKVAWCVAVHCFKWTCSHETLFSHHLASTENSSTWNQFILKISFLKLKPNQPCRVGPVKNTATNFISAVLRQKLY